MRWGCPSVSLSVCRQNAYIKTRFSEILSNLEQWCLLTTYRKSYMGFSKTHYWTPKTQDGGVPPSWKSWNRHISTKNHPISMQLGLLNCGISVSFLPVPEYLHAQLIQRSVLSIALLMLLAKWEESAYLNEKSSDVDEIWYKMQTWNSMVARWLIVKIFKIQVGGRPPFKKNRFWP